MKKYFAFLLSGIMLPMLFSSCNEEEMPLYQDQHFVHFTQLSEKPYRISFATMPGTDEYVLKIPMTLIGMQLSEDRSYAIEMVTEGDNVTTATTASYVLPENPIFHANTFEDELSLKLIDNPELSTEKRIVLRIAENEYFRPGPVEYRTATIYVTNTLAQPDWWDSDFETIFLGAYSDIKYREFIIATGVSDLSDKTTEEVTAYVREFIYYLRRLDDQGKTLYESDGKTKVLDTINYTNV